MRSWLVNHARVTGWALNILLLISILGLCVAGVIDPVAALLLAFLCYIAVLFAINSCAAWALKDAIQILDEQCDPEPVLNLSQVVLKQNSNSLVYAINAGFALLLLDRKAEAAAVLEPLKTRLVLWSMPQQAALYCICRAELADTEEAAAWLNRLERVAGKTQGIGRLLTGAWAELALRRGETEGGERIFLAALERATCLRVKVACNCTLGKLCLLEGRREEAAEHLRYVAEHGNKLAIRAEAEKLLKSL